MSGTELLEKPRGTRALPVRDSITPYHEALNSYLDSLLQQATAPLQSRSICSDPDAGIADFFDVALGESTPILAPKAKPALDLPLVEQLAPDDPPPESACGVDAPETAEESVQIYPGACLKAELAGYHYAIPLEHVRQVIPFSSRLIQVPGQPKWSVGRAIIAGATFRVIDLHGIATNSNPGDSAVGDDPHLLVLDQADLAVLVGSIGEVVHLDRDEVQWRHERSGIYWRSGVVKQLLTSLVDVEGLCERMLGENWQAC